MTEQLYKGMLKFLDGKNQMITIPGAEDRNGIFYVPESIRIEGRYFLLNKDAKVDEWFEYLETKDPPPRRAPKSVPFSPHLH